jgi:outer membrane protein assembly factor BamB
VRLFDVVGGTGVIAATENRNGGTIASTTLTAFGLESTPKWSATIPDVVGQSYRLDRDSIIVPGRKINVLDSRTGRLISRGSVHEARDQEWDRSYAQGRQFVLAGGLFVFESGADTGERYIEAHNAKGKLFWKNSLSTTSIGSAHNEISIRADRDGIVYTDPEGSVFLVDAKSGDLRWTYATGRIEPSYVSLAPNGDVLVSSFHGMVLRLDYASGHQLWETRAGNDCRNAPLLIDNETVLIGTDGNSIVALRADSGRERWRSRVQSSVPFFGRDEIAIPEVILNGMAIVTTDGCVRAIRLP